MITLYTWGTPNGRKISIALEELQLPYEVRTIDITRGAQREAEFLRLNPNGKIPVITDQTGPDGAPITLSESGAILLYLAGKAGRLLPRDLRERLEVMQWLMFQMASVGPMLGQVHHFLRYAPDLIPYAIERYTSEAQRIYGVIDQHLGERAWLAGNDYSIADIATFPWIARHDWQGIELRHYPALKRWYQRIAERPAVVRGMAVP